MANWCPSCGAGGLLIVENECGECSVMCPYCGEQGRSGSDEEQAWDYWKEDKL